MKSIRLDCPECDEPLELDAGFAGGVCRCSNCGTLMTVPESPTRGKAEKLQRPDEPGQAAKPATKPRPTKSRTTAPPLAAGTYVTASGRKVAIDKSTKVPTASKRIKAARYGTTAAFVAVMAVILGAAGYLGYRLVNQTISDPPDTTPVERFVFTAGADPATLPASNVLGIPVGRETAVIVDASAGADDWRGPTEAVLVAGLMRPPLDRRSVMVLYANGEAVSAWHNRARPLEEVGPAELKAFMAGVDSSGEARLAAALERVVDAGVNHAVIISGRPLSRDDAAPLLKVADGVEGLRVEVVMVDGADSVGLDDLVVATQPEEQAAEASQRYQNVYTRIEADRIQDWADAVE